ncbi:MAG: hypothetical protein FJ293_01535 [Planctomycetes bacterium]|nr:hypothetical protein [Planctomycetota bacterium]
MTRPVVSAATPPWTALVALALLASTAPAQVQVHAGPNQRLPVGQTLTRLAGKVRNLSPLSFWVADGDGATEDKLLQWHDQTGLTSVGPLTDGAGKTYGWPSDFEEIQGVVYGIETFHKKLCTLDANTGVCTPVGGTQKYSRLFGLSYDAQNDKLYGVDQSSRKLLTFDRTTGAATVVLTLPSNFTDIRGIAYSGGDGKVYFCDDATETLQRVDPSTKVVEHVLDLNDGPDAKVDEIEFHAGALFCSYRSFDPATALWSMQLARIDLVDQIAIPYGPVIPDCSAHSLLIRSVPEIVRWEQVAGPLPAHLVDKSDPTTPVRFDAPGRYVFELRASTFSRVRDSDQVIIVIEHGPIQPPGSGATPPRTTK